MADVVEILGARVDMVTMDEACARVMAMMDEAGTHVVYTPNSEILLHASKTPEFLETLNRADLMVPDGIGVVHASRILKKPLAERVGGFDLSCAVLGEMGKRGKSVFLLGSKPGVAEAAAETLRARYAGLVIAGVHDGYFKEDEAVVAQINAAKPDYLMVCLGFPKQELWIDKNRDRLDARVMIGAGGSLDVFAGTVQRAPEFFCKHGLEWLYRLIRQPSRFVRMLALPKFGIKVFLKGKRY